MSTNKDNYIEEKNMDFDNSAKEPESYTFEDASNWTKYEINKLQNFINKTFDVNKCMEKKVNVLKYKKALLNKINEMKYILSNIFHSHHYIIKDANGNKGKWVYAQLDKPGRIEYKKPKNLKECLKSYDKPLNENKIDDKIRESEKEFQP